MYYVHLAFSIIGHMSALEFVPKKEIQFSADLYPGPDPHPEYATEGGNNVII